MINARIEIAETAASYLAPWKRRQYLDQMAASNDRMDIKSKAPYETPIVSRKKTQCHRPTFAFSHWLRALPYGATNPNLLPYGGMDGIHTELDNFLLAALSKGAKNRLFPNLRLEVFLCGTQFSIISLLPNLLTRNISSGEA